ncbi:4-(cytidine 5'-diphospho)-2-C-methyl-D-erythritol kinase [Brumimicrobium glaciale]|uniref:4-diphosphocytidyl-2-C-methyl-D-erythritol kinase n=1 Tax=Brumimicrobium glaciale TaxID=200475 RepID=A0A4Q4KJG8_9FLAO|nr:4-(cytidine 5'-diphospho)-2-C-methyl-D-erythritol kinase [Brumimicrobium glaciale]RYM33392.1 4-(cytidine 5'-diphospho)-2-C-methyl-D-erythritol kinase [Brumimicrobium glaciale]
MISFPICKINLGLNILAKRKDGYHEINSLMYPVPVKDVLEIVPADEFKFESAGLPIPGESKNNLVLLAYEMIKEEFNIPPVSIFLYKNIPMGGGLGGGSSNGAFTLKILNELFQLGMSTEDLKVRAVKLGSDCAFFIESTSQIAKGKGEILTEFDLTLKGKTLVLVNNGLHISTKDAYGRINPKTPTFLLENVLLEPIKSWKETLINDFEEPTLAVYPELNIIKEKLYDLGATYAAMTGSGSTMFGVFDTAPDLKGQFEYEGGFIEIVKL